MTDIHSTRDAAACVVCADCGHFRVPAFMHLDPHEFARCVHPRLKRTQVSAVTGRSVPAYCEVVRDEYGECGPGGKLFEPADGTPELIEEPQPFEPLTLGQFGVR